MKNKTRYKKSYNLKATIFSVLFIIIFVTVLIYLLVKVELDALEKIVIIFLLLFILIGLFGVVIGNLKGKSQIVKENKIIKETNPYIYFRELPNNFSIGIASLLFDSTIENFKDIIAIILDLCASHQEIKINKEPLLKQDKLKQRHRNHLIISVIFAILIFILFLFEENILKALGYSVIFFVIIYGILFVPFYLLNIFTAMKNIGKQTKDINYKNVINNNLIKT